MQPLAIQTLIEQGLPDSIVSVEGDGRHFNATVIAAEFAGMSRIAKQQRVHATLGDRILTGEIHAISIKTFTPDEWQQHNQGAN